MDVVKDGCKSRTSCSQLSVINCYVKVLIGFDLCLKFSDL